jgi:UDP-glucose 4-epimerase
MGGLESTNVPAFMVEASSGAAIRDFMTANDPVSARVNASTAVATDDDWQDIMAGFSSRGPSRFDVLAPTFAAPGVNILAAAAARDGDADQYIANNGNRSFLNKDFFNGTFHR